MIQPPPLPGSPRKKDVNDLELLVTFHFVGAALAFLALLFLLVHFAMFHTIFANPKMWEGQKGGPPPAEFFAIFKWFYLFFGFWLVASGVLNVISGLCLRSRKRRTFSMVVAGFNCVHIPLGTVLGIFTIIVLQRESVRELYETSPERNA